MMIYIIHAYECLRGISEIIMKPVKSTLDQYQMFLFHNLFLSLIYSIYTVNLMGSVKHKSYILFLKKLQENVDNLNKKYLRGL